MVDVEINYKMLDALDDGDEAAQQRWFVKKLWGNLEPSSNQPQAKVWLVYQGLSNH